MHASLTTKRLIRLASALTSWGLIAATVAWVPREFGALVLFVYAVGWGLGALIMTRIMALDRDAVPRYVGYLWAGNAVLALSCWRWAPPEALCYAVPAYIIAWAMGATAVALNWTTRS